MNVCSIFSFPKQKFYNSYILIIHKKGVSNDKFLVYKFDFYLDLPKQQSTFWIRNVIFHCFCWTLFFLSLRPVIVIKQTFDTMVSLVNTLSCQTFMLWFQSGWYLKLLLLYSASPTWGLCAKFTHETLRRGQSMETIFSWIIQIFGLL